MGLLSKLLHKEAPGHFACSNCYDPIDESTYRRNHGVCELCALSEAAGPESPLRQLAEGRHRVAEFERTKNKKCATCGRSGESIMRETEALRRAGQIVRDPSYPMLLYCIKCQKYFCGRCQNTILPGGHAGCPRCGTDLEQ